MKKRLWLITVFLIGLCSIQLSGSAACGGLFCTTSPVDQTAERIIFAVNKDAGTITAVVGIAYSGSSDSFSWVVPVPTPPQLDVAETKSLDAFSQMTNLQFMMPPNPCPQPAVMAASGPGGIVPTAADHFLQTGQVGPYDYAIIRNTKSDEMIKWLKDNGYVITPAMEPLVTVYVKEGLYFLAMKLKQGATANQIKPVVMTYQAVHPMIPLRLTAVAAVPNMQVVTWILGDVQYVPVNYAHPRIDWTKMRAGMQPVQESGLTYTVLASYRTEQKRIQDQYQGKAFVTEFAQPAGTLIEALDGAGLTLDPVVSGLLSGHKYIARLRAQISPDQMTVDPTFNVDPASLDVSNVIDVSQYVDAKTFWGCQ